MWAGGLAHHLPLVKRRGPIFELSSTLFGKEGMDRGGQACSGVWDKGEAGKTQTGLCKRMKPLKIKAFLKFSFSKALFSKLQLLVSRSGGIFEGGWKGC